MTTGLTLANFPQPGESIQRMRRDYRQFTDQHNRIFGAQAEIATSQPIGELMPEGFSPPWLPPMRFAKWAKTGHLHFRWDYATMAAELAGDTSTYYQDAGRMATEKGETEPEIGGPVPRWIRNVLGKPPLSPMIPLACERGDPWMLGQPGAAVNPILKEILEQGVGNSSKETLAYIQKNLDAYVAGHAVPMVPSVPVPVEVTKAAKSITDEEELPPLIASEVTYQQFVKSCGGRGMKMPDIIAAWNAHKAALLEDEALAPAAA